MRNIDPNELKRLRSLEDRLAKTKEEAKGWATERKELVAKLTALQKKVEQLTASEKEARQNAAAAQKEATAAIDAAKKESAAAVEAATKEKDEAIAAIRKETDEKIAAIKADADQRVKEAKENAKESDKEAKKKEQETGQTTKKLSALVEENKKLAESLQALENDREVLAKAGESLRKDLDASQSENTRILGELKTLNQQVVSLNREATSLRERITMAEGQLKQENKIPLIPASEVARLTGDLVDQLRTGVGGLVLRDGELKLKLAVGEVDKKAGFVVPTPDSSPEVRESLHEFTIRFDRQVPEIKE